MSRGGGGGFGDTVPPLGLRCRGTDGNVRLQERGALLKEQRGRIAPREDRRTAPRSGSGSGGASRAAGPTGSVCLRRPAGWLAGWLAEPYPWYEM